MNWVDAFIQGLLLGGLYAQYAIGMALMFGVMRIVNIAHGDLVILLGRIGIAIAALTGAEFGLVALLLVPLGALIGWLLQRGILNRVVGADPLPSHARPRQCSAAGPPAPRIPRWCRAAPPTP